MSKKRLFDEKRMVEFMVEYGGDFDYLCNFIDSEIRRNLEELVSEIMHSADGKMARSEFQKGFDSCADIMSDAANLALQKRGIEI